MELFSQKKITPLLLLQLLLLASLPILPCFNDLGKLPIRIWDEARQAHNAYEMYFNHNYWVPTFDGLPDTFGTKPAILIWMQVWSMKLFGINEFAVRFPSAASTWLLSVIVMLFVWKYFQNYGIALLAGIILLSSEGLIRTHVARTGDFDAPLALFSGLACLSFFVFLDSGKKMYWYFTCICLALGVLMKGTAGVLFVPSLIIFALIQKQFIALLKSKHTYLGIIIFLALVMGYYFIRNAYQPGYLNLVIKAEWQSMYLKPAQGHSEEFWFYGLNLINRLFKGYFIYIPLSFIALFLIKNERVKKIGWFCLCCLIGFFLIISFSATKLPWYDAPMYSLLAVFCVLIFYTAFQITIKENQIQWINIMIVIVSFGYGFSKIKPKIINVQEDYQEKYFYNMATYLQKANSTNENLDGYKILSGQSYAPHHTFYIKQMQARSQNVKAVVFDSIYVNDLVMVAETNIQEILLQKYYTTELRHENDIFAYRLDSLKTHDTSK